MGKIPSCTEAKDILLQYNADVFHLKHAETVSGVLGWFARKYDPDMEEYYAAVGMLHDVDLEACPGEHCTGCYELLRNHDIDEAFIDAVASHGYDVVQFDVAPKTYMEKVLYAVDELTGLIGAAALMRPSKSVSDITYKSVIKKFKSPSFAVGVSREIIQTGADMMEVSLQQLIEDTIVAMQNLLPVDQLEEG
ncbi:MAG: hydrolase [Oscillospiraceae bacterium]|nr:hydrolase [Oscillospiraceae bacterium]